ncbi:virion core protein, T7 gp14 family [Pelagibacterium luteolum]|uniref:Uncharacterized protein n=1 Tax=Pelagibacterium luteolum TaxID=440168 RepID=A0A1G7ZIR4_9HYPH|nr:hypothetical protein [Pelagibacterium luteolum]SDH08529.1 hypothetical protein SAMN04487974_12039 [Pelagibacterium luteolum]
MAPLPVIAGIAGVAGAGLQIVGTMAQARGQREAGKAAEEDAYFEAAQLEDNSKEEFAASQRDALERRREGRLANSAAQARAAASGGGAGADAPTIMRIMGDIASRAEYGAQAALFGGESRRAGMFTQAEATRRTGRSQRRGSELSAMGTMFSGLSSGFSSLAGAF